MWRKAIVERGEAMNTKKMAAEEAVALIKDGMIVGLGTGSTAYWAIAKIGQRVKKGLNIRAIATSKESEAFARELNIPIVTFSEVNEIDITIDGADEVDSNLNLIKGGGGALLREKIIATASEKLIVVVDEGKLVKILGAFPLPLEVIPFGVESTRSKIENLGCKTEIRMTDKFEKFITDNGNFILDCEFFMVKNPKKISHELNRIPGVVDSGLFIGLAHKVFVGRQNGSVDIIQKNGSRDMNLKIQEKQQDD